MKSLGIRCAVTIYLLLTGFLTISAQHLTSKKILDSLTVIDNNDSYSDSKKLEYLYKLKEAADKNLNYDSNYAMLLFEIGAYEAVVYKNFATAINYISNALKINISNVGSKYYATKYCYDLAQKYATLGLYNQALIYYDSTIVLARTFSNASKYISYSKLKKAYTFYLIGDYQKAVEVSIDGINYSLQKKDSSYFLAFLNQKAQSLYFKNNLKEALADINIVIPAARYQNELFELATALKTNAFILEKEGNFSIADSLFKESIKTRIKTEDLQQIATDYNDYANLYLDSLHNYNKAKQLYIQSIFYGKKLQDSIVLARANANIGELYLKQKKYKESSAYCIQAFKYLKLSFADNIHKNATSDQLNFTGTKELVLMLMINKIRILLGFFSKTKDQKDLSACLQTALITDTLITKMRNMQSGAESKLYWRNYTREFYTNAIEASYLDNNPNLAFYFMEKSRAVLLNDKLNELDASSYLSKNDAAKQEAYEIKVIELEQKLSALSDSSKQNQTIQLQLLDAKSNFEQFIKSLEQNYPVYYQYKYADAVPSLKDLQNYLAKNNQSFVHYFLDDTVTYILTITANNTKLIRLSQKEFNKVQLEQFLQVCANKEMLNNHYDSFALLSNSIYKKIFQPLQLPKGRIIICADNIVIPFDALCTDVDGKRFLLNDYSFSYVYSARFLLKQFNNPAAEGNFVGFAPVSFSKTLDVNDLKNAADALHASASYYSNDKLFTHQNATRHNFFDYASSYSIVSIFSHARADTTDNEPVLYMQDSLIHLSELQLLNNPATKLVLLSACQTNVGKTATGEGIYSLARGFATAGIPSVAATLWKADEQTIYAISEKFNQYLSEGMTKDEALRKAKLYFIQNNSDEKMLPYYWANMIVIGNTDTIKLIQNTSSITTWHFIYFCVAVVLAFIFIYTRRKIKISNNKKQVKSPVKF